MRKPIHLPLGKGLRGYCLLVFLLLGGKLAAQPCPAIINCPQSTLTHCDESSNDLSLWNNAPFTYSPSIGDANLHEGPIDLNIKVKGCNGGGLVSISYLLYLDLDNDDLQETVIMSGTPPPGGIVMANNSFNPGYSGGDTVRFDQRALPDSMLYRFTLEIAYSGDTTTGWVRFSNDHAPYEFSPVLLPEGRHRIEWRIVQDGVERYCDRNFKVKDCKKPNIACKSGLSVYLDQTQTATLSMAQALQSVSDNITPDTQLVLSMRRVGTGSGFPSIFQDTAMFSCQNAENQFVEIWAKDKVGNADFCTTHVLVYDTSGVCPFGPLPSICAHSYWNDLIIKGVDFRSTYTPPAQSTVVISMQVGQNGCAELSSLPPASSFTLSARKDTLPLNGVTTYDLVLISKHILGIEPLNEGWKIKAADANRSNSVTTFDIVELRKLILGLTTKLPNNTPSWLFYVDSCTAWNSPFYGNCPTEYQLPVQPLSAYPPHLSFKGLKVGDVNGSASSVDTLQSSALSRESALVLEIPDGTLKAGQTLEVPLRALEGGQWDGLQFSLKFDPKLVEITRVEPDGVLGLNTENWAIPQAGMLNLSWSDAIPATILPGDALMRLSLKARSDISLSRVFELNRIGSLLPEVYEEGGSTHALTLNFPRIGLNTSETASQVFDPMPNPTSGSARIPLRLQEAESVILELHDLSGRLLWRSQTSLDSGAHFLEIPAQALPQSGVYVWHVSAGNCSQSGKLVRI